MSEDKKEPGFLDMFMSMFDSEEKKAKAKKSKREANRGKMAASSDMDMLNSMMGKKKK